MTPLIRNLLLAFALAAILYVGYLVFFKDSELALNTTNDLVTNQAIKDAQEFLVKLQQLKSIELEGDLFTDPRFRLLVDLRKDITQEPVGRANPFLPVRN